MSERKRGARNILEMFPGVDVARVNELVNNEHFRAKRALVGFAAKLRRMSEGNEEGIKKEDIQEMWELFTKFHLPAYGALNREVEKGNWTLQEETAARGVMDGRVTTGPSTRP